CLHSCERPTVNQRAAEHRQDFRAKAYTDFESECLPEVAMRSYMSSRPRKNIVLEQDSQLALSRNVKGCGSDRPWRSLMPLSAARMAACGHTCPRTHAAPTEEASSVCIRTKW